MVLWLLQPVKSTTRRIVRGGMLWGARAARWVAQSLAIIIADAGPAIKCFSQRRSYRLVLEHPNRTFERIRPLLDGLAQHNTVLYLGEAHGTGYGLTTLRRSAGVLRSVVNHWARFFRAGVISWDRSRNRGSCTWALTCTEKANVPDRVLPWTWIRSLPTKSGSFPRSSTTII